MVIFSRPVQDRRPGKVLLAENFTEKICFIEPFLWDVKCFLLLIILLRLLKFMVWGDCFIAYYYLEVACQTLIYTQLLLIFLISELA